MQHCLIIDDSPIIRRVARLVVEDFGFEVREAEHGRQAFELCAIHMPDVVLLDWQLPVMGAYEFMKALRAYGPKHWPYIVYCTTECNFLDFQRARGAGAADILMKPFDRSMLAATFAKLSFIAAATASPDAVEPGDRRLRRFAGPVS